MANPASILFLGYHRCGEQDTLVPWEMLKSLAWVLSQQKRDLQITLGTFDGGAVTMQMGAVVQTERKLAPDARADVLYVPGGLGSGDATKDQRLLDMIRAHHSEGRWVATNCSGIALLQRARILGDTPVTAAATVSRKLAREGTKVTAPRKMWVCDPKKKIFTAAGGSAVHPSTIALIWHLFGEDLALQLSLMWDTLGAHGKQLFALQGPDYGTYPEYEATLQTQWEDSLLPGGVTAPV